MKATQLLIAAALVTPIVPAEAAVTVSIYESGADVIFSASGTLDLTGTDGYGGFFTDPSYSSGGFVLGPSSFPAASSFRSGFSGPAALGSVPGPFLANAATGAPFGISTAYFGPPMVIVAANFVSGDAVAATATFENRTLSSMGLTLGSQYVYTSPADTITIRVIEEPAGAVPEPASWALMIAGFGILGAATRQRSWTGEPVSVGRAAGG